MGKTAPSMPTWAMTIGRMIDFGARVTVWCDECGGFAVVDLIALAEKVGRDYSLVDRRCRCRLQGGCIGWNKFRYASSERGVPWNLSTDVGVQARIERDWEARTRLADGIRQHRHDMAAKKRREQH